MVMKERDEELTLFFEMRRREKENERNNLLINNCDELEASNLESKCGSSPISKIVPLVPPRKTVADELLNSENEKSEYEWLLTPPDTPLFPSLEMEKQKMVINQVEIPLDSSTALRSGPANIQSEPALRGSVTSKNSSVISGLNTSTVSSRRPSSSGGLTPATSRSTTPSGRPTLPSMTKSSRSSTPSSRSTITSTNKSSRSLTPSSRSTISSTKPTAAPVRSSTPARVPPRSATPPARPSLPASKTTARSATPTHRPSAPSASAPTSRSSSASKARPSLANNSVPSRGSSPTVKSRPGKPSEMRGFSLDAHPNLKTLLPQRPTSTSRSRSGATNSRSSMVDSGNNQKPKRQSCSPSKGRISNGLSYSNRSSAASKNHPSDGDHESPVVIGTKMVERVVNMRKLAPPKNNNHQSTQKNNTGKSSLSDSSGFGRTLSKKSLDMALRHMDIRRSIQGNLHPLVTNIPTSSVYSVRLGSTKSHPVSVSDSPIATSSNASSEPSVNNNSICLDGIEVEDVDSRSERGNCSPTSQHSAR